ncbi:MAG: hypothetical protein HQK52_19520 [Oligoflexia bacterium]|nr:hypothetical protein [Oligoflexia bacterium]
MMTVASLCLSNGLSIRINKTLTTPTKAHLKARECFEVVGDTRNVKETLKAIGGIWFAPKQCWSFFKDPTELLKEKLPLIEQRDDKHEEEETEEALHSPITCIHTEEMQVESDTDNKKEMLFRELATVQKSFKLLGEIFEDEKFSNYKYRVTSEIDLREWSVNHESIEKEIDRLLWKDIKGLEAIELLDSTARQMFSNMAFESLSAYTEANAVGFAERVKKNFQKITLWSLRNVMTSLKELKFAKDYRSPDIYANRTGIKKSFRYRAFNYGLPRNAPSMFCGTLDLLDDLEFLCHCLKIEKIREEKVITKEIIKDWGQREKFENEYFTVILHKVGSISITLKDDSHKRIKEFEKYLNKIESIEKILF